MLYHVGLIDRP